MEHLFIREERDILEVFEYCDKNSIIYRKYRLLCTKKSQLWLLSAKDKESLFLLTLLFGEHFSINYNNYNCNIYDSYCSGFNILNGCTDIENLGKNNVKVIIYLKSDYVIPAYQSIFDKQMETFNVLFTETTGNVYINEYNIRTNRKISKIAFDNIEDYDMFVKQVRNTDFIKVSKTYRSLSK